MTRTTRRIALIALAVALFTAGPVRPASALPPWLEGLGDYRDVDASGRVEPRLDPGRDRVALRPVPTSPLLRARPFYLSGYPGATYGASRNRAPVFNETGYYAGRPKSCGHSGPCRHGR